MDWLFDVVIVRPPGESYKNCVSTNPERLSIDVNLAKKQHREYVKILKENWIEVIELEPLERYPDSVFVQDTAVVGVKSNLAILSRFGEPSRRGEEESIGKVLRKEGFEIKRIEEPGTLEGGDVLVTDVGIVFVGLSQRTNIEGIKQLVNFFLKLKVVSVPISKIFHLLSGVSYLGSKTIAISPQVVDVSYFGGFKLIQIPEDELYANNMLYLGEKRVLLPEGYPKTEEKLRREGFKPITVNVSEFWKGDGGVTCLNLPFYNVL
ncbi:arginine deiminase family protein [Thermococcus aggregans]|uniref:Arginine deiminase family protein n=1 Tax=Thermococcus aggregans TaxID=110163 RepID=A0A9E7MWU0_THEAG|nr:arginine deiminase family protein [Thermococcus aggregans]USS40379.1 arginine deiminase family protein [Thermococcus aggregans]